MRLMHFALFLRQVLHSRILAAHLRLGYPTVGLLPALPEQTVLPRTFSMTAPKK
jgi:hypothetical protein